MAAPLLGRTRGFYYDLCDLTMQSALGAVDLSFVEIHGISESTTCKHWWASRRAEEKKKKNGSNHSNNKNNGSENIFFIML